jgi:hypothetical protein
LGAYLQFGDGEGVTQVELISYLKPIGEKWNPDTPMSNVGCSHIAFATENCIDELYEELVTKGINFISPPQEIEEEGEVLKFCYFKDSDGITLELIGS